MFAKKSAAYKEAEDIINSLAYSFLRGSVHESPGARNTLGDQLANLAPELTAKERAKLRSNPPNIVAAFPQEAKRNFESFLNHAFG
ncbi:hypothetical protein [Pseudonocardia xishanensis]|uniref:Uncharacterized protein n=1 Tax=Pseudonocardia xishanensis TaxID=630995 RepID=A0ABP8RC98_9PSEU